MRQGFNVNIVDIVKKLLLNTVKAMQLWSQCGCRAIKTLMSLTICQNIYELYMLKSNSYIYYRDYNQRLGFESTHHIN
jgi:hypothetical protein